MTATVHKLATARGRLECSVCGASAKAACDCNAPYVPAGTRAAAAVAATPNKSDRAIAADIGVSHTTVQKARKSTGNKLPVDKRTGRDGRKRTAPKPKAPKTEGEVQRQASINIRPSDWDEFKRRSDAHGQSAAATLGLLVQQHLGVQGRRSEPTISNPVAEVNGFHRELVRFTTAFSERFTAWLESNPVLDDDGRAALMQALYLCADECNELAQKLDGR